MPFWMNQIKKKPIDKKYPAERLIEPPAGYSLFFIVGLDFAMQQHNSLDNSRHNA